MVDWKEHVREAVRLVGSQHALAEAIKRQGFGCSQSKISWLLISAENISAEDALAIDRATSGKVSKSTLRPDLWPREAA